MSLSAALGAGVARLTLMQASGELMWLPIGVVRQLEKLSGHWAQNDVARAAYTARDESDDLAWRQLDHEALDMELELNSLLWEVAEAYTSSQPGLWDAQTRVGGTLTLPGGHTLRVSLHSATCWLLDVFGGAADNWVRRHARPQVEVVRP